MLLESPFPPAKRKKKWLVESITAHQDASYSVEVAEWFRAGTKGWSYVRVFAVPFPMPLGIWIPPFNISIFPSHTGNSVSVVCYGVNHKSMMFGSHESIKLVRSTHTWTTVDVVIRVYKSCTLGNALGEKAYPAFYEVHVNAHNLTARDADGGVKTISTEECIGSWFADVHIGKKTWLRKKEKVSKSTKNRKPTIVRNDGGILRSACIISNRHHLLDRACAIISQGIRTTEGKISSLMCRLTNEESFEHAFVRMRAENKKVSQQLVPVVSTSKYPLMIS